MSKGVAGIACQVFGVLVALAGVAPLAHSINPWRKVKNPDQLDEIYRHVHLLELLGLAIGGMILAYLLFRLGKRLRS